MKAIHAPGLLLLMLLPTLASAAQLPAHAPRRILIIADAVNPHGLSDAQLTQPADIKAALEAGDSGLSLVGGTVTLVDSQCVDLALTQLASATPPDAVVYFAHTGAHACSGGGDRQPQLTAALEAFLQGGGGVVVYHHGLYYEASKAPLLQLLGGQASGILWDTTTGQRVFRTDAAHFVTTNSVSYGGTAMLTGGGGIPSGTFSYFDNIPDERYPTTSLLTEAGEQREILFATDTGGLRVLGYALQRSGWQGRVVFYQPAEYQPNALDDRVGPNFQIFVNAIHFVSRPPGAGGTPDAGMGGPDGAVSTPDAAVNPPPPPQDDGGCGVSSSSQAPLGWAILAGAWLLLARRRRSS